VSANLLVAAHLKRLKLPAIARSYEAMAREAAAANQSFEGYLLALLEQEVRQRDENLQRSRLQSARFPAVKTLDQFDFSAIPDLNKARVLHLAQGEYADRRENILFIGNNGTGKTHLAIGLGVCACRQGRRVRFVTAPALVNELTEARKEYRLSRLEAYYQRVEVLILDELGFVPFARDGAELFFNLCAARYERRTTIVTSNLEFSRWPEVLGDHTLAGALVDRLTHHAHIIQVNGESYRFRESLRRMSSDVAPDGGEPHGGATPDTGSRPSSGRRRKAASEGG
jgi:DNA replication protein DnaC